MVELHEQYNAQGFQVMAFPCNQFGNGNTYEPDSNSVVQAFVEERTTMFGSFPYTGFPYPVFAKSTVNEPMCNQPASVGCRPESVECCTANNVVYNYLRSQISAQDEVGWNFDKYLIGKNGEVLGHYAAGTDNSASGCGASWAGCTSGLIEDIEAALLASPGSAAEDSGPFECRGAECPKSSVTCDYLSVVCGASLGQFPDVVLLQGNSPLPTSTMISDLCPASCAAQQSGH